MDLSVGCADPVGYGSIQPIVSILALTIMATVRCWRTQGIYNGCHAHITGEYGFSLGSMDADGKGGNTGDCASRL